MDTFNHDEIEELFVQFRDLVRKIDGSSLPSVREILTSLRIVTNEIRQSYSYTCLEDGCDGRVLDEVDGGNIKEGTGQSPCAAPRRTSADSEDTLDNFGAGEATEDNHATRETTATHTIERENNRRERESRIPSSMKGSAGVPDNEPRGRINIDGYDVAVLIASGWGIVSQLPYLLRGCRSTPTRLQRIHLIWEIDHLGSFFICHP
jgi:hypothetical protein